LAHASFEAAAVGDARTARRAAAAASPESGNDFVDSIINKVDTT